MAHHIARLPQVAGTGTAPGVWGKSLEILRESFHLSLEHLNHVCWSLHLLLLFFLYPQGRTTDYKNTLFYTNP